MKQTMLQYLKCYYACGKDEKIIKEFIDNFFKHCQPERTSPEDRGPKIIVQTCGDWEAICDVPNSDYK